MTSEDIQVFRNGLYELLRKYGDKVHKGYKVEWCSGAISVREYGYIEFNTSNFEIDDTGIEVRDDE